MTWHVRMETLKEKVKQHETELPLFRERSAEKIVELALLQTGELLTLASFSVSFADLLMRAEQYSSVSLVMEEATRYAFWATANRTMNMCEQLRTLISPLMVYSSTTKRVGVMLAALVEIEDVLHSLLDEHGY